ncbi:hypothetical protein IFM89_001411 [Coptis chinensis]|uniref:Uncharacterized protein n=1 Tax=Coptis chinensis TaxID=261450 RepID=A0A835I8Z8_9MAGN|nr:hypothetical protein IFM89_001411 [Coptis chinensis]
MQMEAKHIVPIKSETDTSTEEENTHEFTYVEYGGVSPKELERRLHELLEERQRKRIRELECALEHTKKKLLEKEMEVTWWKDTARLISLHASEANSSLSR